MRSSQTVVEFFRSEQFVVDPACYVHMKILKINAFSENLLLTIVAYLIIKRVSEEKGSVNAGRKRFSKTRIMPNGTGLINRLL